MMNVRLPVPRSHIIAVLKDKIQSANDERDKLLADVEKEKNNLIVTSYDPHQYMLSLERLDHELTVLEQQLEAVESSTAQNVAVEFSL
jgi:hypothetical protein